MMVRRRNAVGKAIENRGEKRRRDPQTHNEAYDGVDRQRLSRGAKPLPHIIFLSTVSPCKSGRHRHRNRCWFHLEGSSCAQARNAAPQNHPSDEKRGLKNDGGNSIRKKKHQNRMACNNTWVSIDPKMVKLSFPDIPTCLAASVVGYSGINGEDRIG